MMKLTPLTKADDHIAWVNFSNVTYMVQNRNGETVIYFSTGSTVNVLNVKETPEEIQKLLES